MWGIWLATFMAAFTFIYFIAYPVVAYFKDPKGMIRDTLARIPGLTKVQDFESTRT